MLKKLGEELNTGGVEVRIGDAAFPAPFPEELEYSSPARGTWNIVHTGLLIPEAHEIFVCARGCLRGVVLTAAEANALSRYSAIQIREENVLDGTMEELMIDGVADVLAKLPYRPRAVLIYISCQHFFLAYDQEHVYATLREQYPDIRFADCYMIPTLRKSGITPDQKMRIQLYSMLDERAKDPSKISLIGSNLPVSPTCEWLLWLERSGYRVQSLNRCGTFDDYLEMGASFLNLYYEPLARMAAESLEERLGQEAWYLPFVFDPEQLDGEYARLAGRLGLPAPDFSDLREKADGALRHAKELIGDTPVAVDYTFTFRLLSFTRMLLSYGFNVTEIYADSFLPEEREDFDRIREHCPGISVWATNRPKMRFASRRRDGKILAVGQKAAFFTGTDYFVNVAESGGFYGYDGMIRIARLMEEAFLAPKDGRSLIQRKGYGCESCL